jgi:heat shock protein HslJ
MTFAAGATTITFGDLVVTEMACTEGAANTAESHMIQLLAPGSASFEIDANVLTIQRDDVGIMGRTE